MFLRILYKTLWLFVTFLGITLISFFVIHLAPGSPTDLQTTLSPEVSTLAREQLQKLYGLDKPLHEQYVQWVKRLIEFDFGYSFSDNRPVWDKIKERLPLTFGMNITALFITLMLAIPIGIYSAWKQGGIFDKSMTILVFIGFAMPSFWLALLLMNFFGIIFPVLPISGLHSFSFEQMTFPQKVVDIAKHLILPLFIYVFSSLTGISRFMRSSMLEVLRQDYIRTAKAKGLKNSVILFKHALKNAIMPVITILGLSIPGLIGGSVIIESIFSLPGLGQLFYQGIMTRDYPLIMANLVLGALLTLLGNILADVGYALADPRIRK